MGRQEERKYKMNTYGLVRISSLSQKENTSLSFQSNRIKEYCKLFDLSLTGIIKETGSGGVDLENRKGLTELQSLIENGSCKTIIVNKVDRLGRSLLQGLIFLKYCEDKGVRVICIENGIDTDNPQSKLITNILFSIAENEKEQIKIRCNSGREKTFSDKKIPYGSISYGYQKTLKGSIVVNKEESEIVQFIFQKHNQLLKRVHLSKTKRTQLLLQTLRDKNYKFHGKDFEWWNVKHILSNPFYCGVMKWKDKTTNHMYDTIVSKRLYNKINSCI